MPPPCGVALHSVLPRHVCCRAPETAVGIQNSAEAQLRPRGVPSHRISVLEVSVMPLACIGVPHGQQLRDLGPPVGVVPIEREGRLENLLLHECPLVFIASDHLGSLRVGCAGNESGMQQHGLHVVACAPQGRSKEWG